MNVALKLARAEILGSRGANFYVQVPPRLQIPIEGILDTENELKSCILLGFCRDGNHLLSYTSTPVAAADGKEGHCLQLWSFDQHSRCRKLWNVPLFRTDSSLEQPDDEEDFSVPPSSLSVTVAETPGGKLFVVHGRPTEADERDRLANHLTIIPGPRYAAAAQQLQVVHISYHTAPPHPPFNPFMAILLPSAGPSTAVGVACNLGDGLRLLAVKVWASNPPAAQPMAPEPASSQAVQLQAQQQYATAAAWQQSQQQQQQQQMSIGVAGGAGAAPSGDLSQAASHGMAEVPDGLGGNCSVAHLASMEHGREPARSRAGMDRDTQPSTDAATPAAAIGSPGGGGGGTGTGAAVAAEQLAAEISLIQGTVVCCGASDRSGGSSGRNACSGAQHIGGAQCIAAASASPVGRALDWEELILGALRHQNLRLQSLQDYGTALVAQGAWRGRAGLLAVALLRLRGQEGPAALCLLVHIAAATGHAQVIESLEAPFPWQEDLNRALQRSGAAGPATVSLDRVAAFVADWLRCRHSVPSTRAQLVFVLTNRSVLVEGRSLKFLAHPWLPQCLLGYGAAERVQLERE